MDAFVAPSVPLAAGTMPGEGVVAFSASDFTRPNSETGFNGVSDPTFAGIPLSAASPYQCNEKASALAVAYNAFAKVKHDDDSAVKNYDLAYQQFIQQIKAACEYKAGYTAEEIAQDLSRCRKWKNEIPPMPKKPTLVLDKNYSPDQIRFFSVLMNQTVKCFSGTCAPSMDGYAVPQITNLTWTFYSTPASAPFGQQCHVHMRKLTSVTSNSGALTSVGNIVEVGRRALATVPYRRGDCAPSMIGEPTATECTALAAKRGTEENHALNWYFSLPDDNSPVSKTSEVERICRDYESPDHILPECACQNAEEKSSFLKLRSNFASSSKVCWYTPCSRKGIDRLFTPAEEKERLKCNAPVCQSILNIMDSTDVSLSDLKNSLDCSDKSAWDKAEAGKNQGTNSPLSGLKDTLGDIVSNTDWVSIIGLIAALVIAVMILAGAARLFFYPGASTDTSAAVPAPASVTTTPTAPTTKTATAPALRKRTRTR
jgi:hypothetical protein